ncbi:MAG: amidase [Thermoleophilia bacterium]|nr:amidase [Thermoleophilia bacterium]
MTDDDILTLSARELRAQFLARTLSPRELLSSTIERIERVNGALNALVTPTLERAHAEAAAAEAAYATGVDVEKRPLLGLPITVKDNIQTKGIRTTAGSLLLKDFVPEADAPAAERAFAAGSVMLGKTNTPEFGWKGETTNRVFGTTRSPWNLERTPGGSSGGGAACVASGIGPFALGTDGGGSIRIPAAYCGIFGFKATFGLVPYAPNSALESLGHTAVLSRSVRDAALLLSAIAGADPRDRLSLNTPKVDWVAAVDGGVRGLRVAWSPNLGYAPVETEVAAIAREAAFALGEAGATVEEVELDFSDPHDLVYAFFAAANAAGHRDDWEQVRNLVDFGRVEMIEEGFRLGAADIGDALIKRARWSEKMVRFLESYDVLLTPTMPSTAFAAGIDGPPSIAGVPTLRMRWTPFTYGMNLTGQPAASVPSGLASDGLPVGLHVIGRRHDDATVLRVCAAVEAVRPWAHLRPSLLGSPES